MGDDIQRTETRDIRGVDDLHMAEGKTGAGFRVCEPRRLHRIQAQAHGAVSQCMQVDIDIVAGRAGDGRFRVSGGHQRLREVPLRFPVGFQHEGGLRLHRAIQGDFQGAQVEELGVETLLQAREVGRR